MIERSGGACIFVAGSVVGGLALAFVIVALRPGPGPRSPAEASATAARCAGGDASRAGGSTAAPAHA